MAPNSSHPPLSEFPGLKAALDGPLSHRASGAELNSAPPGKPLSSFRAPLGTSRGGGRGTRIAHDKGAYSVKGEDTACKAVLDLRGGAEPTHLYAIFDGHGGKKASVHCAEVMPGAIAQDYGAALGEDHAARLEAACKSAFVRVDRGFCATNEGGDGTTASVVLIDDRSIVTANVGDSTGMLFTLSGVATTLTADHRVERRTVAEEERIAAAGVHVGRAVSRDGRPVGPERIYPGGLNMTRSIGDNDSTPAAIAEPEVSHHSLPLETSLLVLASDGIWDFVNEAQMRKLATAALSKSPGSIAKSMRKSVMRAMASGNQALDDATVYCVEIRGAAESDMEAAMRGPLSKRLASARKLMGGSTARRSSTGKQSSAGYDADASISSASTWTRTDEDLSVASVASTHLNR